MSLAQDILDAVKKGGSERWLPPSYERQKVKQAARSTRVKAIESSASILKKSMGTKRWRIPDLAREVKITPDAARHRLGVLIERGEVKRSQSSPHVYWVA